MLHPVALVTPPRLLASLRRASTWLVVLGVAASLAAGCGDSAQEGAENMIDDAEDVVSSISAGEIDTAAQDLAAELRSHELSTFASAVEQVNLTELVGDEPFTVLAPSDEAFLGLDADSVADLLADPEQLQTLVGNHIISGRLDQEQLSQEDTVTSASGAVNRVEMTGDVLSIGGADVVEADLEAGSAMVHVVDQVFVP